MSRNIKEIGKELMGKSLNSFHRKTGLTQLEKNNEMQDGILDGILSQVDNAYIEKTEQSNVIHLDGSGDGVVVLDSIEGNTMVNLWDNNINWSIYSTSELQGVNANCPQSEMTKKLKANTNYTYVVMGASENINLTNAYLGSNFVKSEGIDVTTPALVTTISDYNPSATVHPHLYPKSGSGLTESDIRNLKILFIEGDHRDKSLNWFEGLQSSFEEKVNDQDKYEIEILSNNKNLLNMKLKNSVNCTVSGANGDYTITPNNTTNNPCVNFDVFIPKGTYYYKGIGSQATQFRDINGVINYNLGSKNDRQVVFTKDIYGVSYNWGSNGTTNSFKFNTLNDIVSVKENEDVIPHKSNKIKVLVNEPLRAINNTKDRLCIKNSKLVIERNCGEFIIDGTNNVFTSSTIVDITPSVNYYRISIPTGKILTNINDNKFFICDKIPVVSYNDRFSRDIQEVYPINGANNIYVKLLKTNASDLVGANNYMKSNPLTLIHQLAEPYYEEVLNEYGEPIILEGYENGTLYIDSVIVPTTTVKYTPKMESFKTLKEVNDNNVMLTNDIDDNIIPYMMEVDLMIMEKEMALPSQINIRKMEVLDMTSMQKRTQDMLERLIKGKTLTEQECKTRVTTYLNANKITDEQAEELMLLISEVYA